MVVCMWCVTLLLPACPLERMWEMAVTEMPVSVVMPATESPVEAVEVEVPLAACVTSLLL